MFTNHAMVDIFSREVAGKCDIFLFILLRKQVVY